MLIEPLAPFSDVLVIRPRIFGDDRGFFLETFRADRLAEAGVDLPFVQDNHSRSSRGVLRGLHFQRGAAAQGKLVRVARGSVFDVAVDLRPDSPTYGRWAGIVLDDVCHAQLYIPPGYGHGSLTIEDDTDFLYKTTAVYQPEAEGALLWYDPDIGIDWPLQQYGIQAPLLSQKDQLATSFQEFNV